MPDKTRNQRIHMDYLLDDKGLLWYAPLGRAPVLAAHQSVITDLTSLIHAMRARPGVAATLVLQR